MAGLDECRASSDAPLGIVAPAPLPILVLRLAAQGDRPTQQSHQHDHRKNTHGLASNDHSLFCSLPSLPRASPTANELARDRHPFSKPAGRPRPELWETSRKCSHGHVNEIFSELRGGNGPPRRNSCQRPVASARTAVKEQSPLGGAALRSRLAPRP